MSSEAEIPDAVSRLLPKDLSKWETFHRKPEPVTKNNHMSYKTVCLPKALIKRERKVIASFSQVSLR